MAGLDRGQQRLEVDLQSRPVRVLAVPHPAPRQLNTGVLGSATIALAPDMVGAHGLIASLAARMICLDRRGDTATAATSSQTADSVATSSPFSTVTPPAMYSRYASPGSFGSANSSR